MTRLRIALLTVASCAAAVGPGGCVRSAPRANGVSEAVRGGGQPGPVTVDPRNPRYFNWRGRAQVFVASSEHYGSVVNPDFDYRQYLATIAADGLNHTRIFLGDYIEDSKAFQIEDNVLEPRAGTMLTPWMRSDAAGAADGGQKFDLNRWNPAFFERLHGFMSTAARHGIVVEAVLFFVGPGWHRAPMNHANNVNATTVVQAQKVLTLDNGNLLARQRAYAEKVVSELNRYDNLIFNLVNEPWFDNQDREGFTSEAAPATRRWMKEAARWVREAESRLPKHHVLTADISNRGVSLRAADLDGDYTALDGFNVHYDSHGLSLVMNRRLGRPLTLNETGFQGTDDAPYRLDGWRYLMMGGALYDHLDYSFTVAHPDGTHVPRFSPRGYTGGGSPALRRQLAALLAFMNALPLEHMAPDDGVVLDTTGEPALIHHALSWPGRVYAVLFPGDGPVTVSLNLAKGRWLAEWLDPLTATVERQQELVVHRWATTLPSHDRHDGGAVLRVCAPSVPPCTPAP